MGESEQRMLARETAPADGALGVSLATIQHVRNVTLYRLFPGAEG